MTDDREVRRGTEFGGDRRRTERRRAERRQDERRTPPPAWRRPAAFVAYGVVATLVVILFGRAVGAGDQAPGARAATVETVTEAAEETPIVAAPLDSVQEAYTVSDFERLIAEGNAAVGRTVRTELYCEPISPVLVRTFEGADAGLVGLTDQEGRVGAAECRWSMESRSSDFLLIVPAELAEQFARLPQEEMNFVQRRRVPATVEWLGRSEELALRISGVLRSIDN